MPKSRSVLGRGLNALIPKPETYDPLTQRTRSEDTAVGPDHRHLGSLEEVIAHLEISKIRPNPYQPRADFDEVALDELKRSIQEKGILSSLKSLSTSQLFGSPGRISIPRPHFMHIQRLMGPQLRDVRSQAGVFPWVSRSSGAYLFTINTVRTGMSSTPNGILHLA